MIVLYFIGALVHIDIQFFNKSKFQITN